MVNKNVVEYLNRTCKLAFFLRLLIQIKKNSVQSYRTLNIDN